MKKIAVSLTTIISTVALSGCGTSTPSLSESGKAGSLRAQATSTICANQTIPDGSVIVEKFSNYNGCNSLPSVWKAYVITDLATAPNSLDACSGQSYPGFVISKFNTSAPKCNDQVVYKSVTINRVSTLPTPFQMCSGQDTPSGWVITAYVTTNNGCRSDVTVPIYTISKLSALPSPTIICTGQPVPAGWTFVQYEPSTQCNRSVSSPAMTIKRS